MDLNSLDESTLSEILEASTETFSELVTISRLDPRRDLQYADLSDVDFLGSDLSEFNFDYADLRRALWSDRLSDPSCLNFALRGKGKDAVSSLDFKPLSEEAINGRLWSERFFAFKILVDNWGTNKETMKVLLDTLETDLGLYLGLCNSIYFFGTFFNDSSSREKCISMANSGRSQTNMYRIKGQKRVLAGYLKMLSSDSIRVSFPSDFEKPNVSVFSYLALPEASTFL